MKTTFLDGRVTLYGGDNREVLRTLADNSIDSVCTDPPYALVSIVKRFGKEGSAAARPEGMGGAYNRLSGGFMGKQWDTGETAFAVEFWAEIFRVLKPGGHVLAFSGTRTYHRMVVAIEDAGFEIRDQIGWAFGSGFPKSHDVSRAIDRRKDWSALPKLQGAIKAARTELGISQSEAARRVGLIGEGERLGGGGYMWFETGMRMPTREQWPRLKEALKLSDVFDACFDEAEREVTGTHEQWTDRSNYAITSKDGLRRDKPASELAEKWKGWGSALKPSYEPVCVAQKPYEPQQEIAMIGSQLATLWCRLWSMLSAKDAAQLSTLNPNAYGVDVSAFAQWSAAERSNTQAALSAAMGTSQFESALISCLSTVSSWNGIWADASRPENTCITETEFGTTTGLRTLRFLLSKITPASITQAHKSGQWSIANASHAERVFNASVHKLCSTLELSVLAGATSREAQSYQGVGATPNWSPICVARKPLIGTIAENVIAHGVGALNIDACRIAPRAGDYNHPGSDKASVAARVSYNAALTGNTKPAQAPPSDLGRWPANLVHDGSGEVLACFPAEAGASAPVRGTEQSTTGSNGIYGHYDRVAGAFHGDAGSAARFFYQAKADDHDRLGSKHPTVKPVDLMQWLVRMVTPKGGTVLDPFAGTGTTGEAAWREGMNAILIEREADYQADIARRMDLADKPTKRQAVAKTKNNLAEASSLPLFGGDQ